MSGCICFVTPEHTWTRYGSAVEPGSQMEPNPECPVHFPAPEVPDDAAGREALAEARSLAEFICWWEQPDPHWPTTGGCAYHAALADQIASDWLAEHDRAVKAAVLEEEADDMDNFAAETYTPDIFRRPTAEDYAAINALLERERGHQLDGVAADCYSRAIKVQVTRLRDRAAAYREGGA